jgi:hypothetical protein
MLMGENNWRTCLQNPLNVVDLKFCAMELGLLPGNYKVICAM